MVVLPEPCRPAIRITAGGATARSSPAFASAHQARQFAVHDADQRLPRREAADHLLAERLRAHRVDEMLHDRQRDVGLQQRDAHFAQRFLHVRLGEARFAADRLDDFREA